MAKRIPRREDDPVIPSRYARSKSGRSYFSIVHTKHRDSLSRRLYRVRYWVTINGKIFHLRSKHLYRAKEILAGGVVFLKRKPSEKVLLKNEL
jgi:hypothetical protein